MTRAVIIDDEEDACEALRIALERHCPTVQLLQTCTSPEEGLVAIGTLKPDVVFLDVLMPEMSGFDLLTRIDTIPFAVIFVSAYDQYAIRAIRFSAVDYLLKPVNVRELVDAIARVVENGITRERQVRVSSLMQNASALTGPITRIAVPLGDTIEMFETNDIIYCKAEGSYSYVYRTNQRKTLVSRHLKDFENLLVDAGFFRIHHSFLINIRHVQRVVKSEGGYVVMSEDYELDISRRKKDEFMNILTRL
ncbi:MAG TPA: LytTR family DNA-binding domain-containing protein [Chryseolinea sp.]